jgi:Flp pilus assembly pilin Flp
MQKGLARFRAEIARCHREEGGQDLVEYALVAVIIALAATAGMGAIAQEINTIFANLAKKIAGIHN